MATGEGTVRVDIRLEPTWRWWKWGPLFEFHLYAGPDRGELEGKVESE